VATLRSGDDGDPAPAAGPPAPTGSAPGSSAGSSAPAPTGAASTGAASSDATAAFFSAYVEADGRVVRHDQGGDTVSEGQAYAMLLALANDDPARFAAVWSWTRDHLQRPDGLLSWRWADGAVLDHSPATDADLDAATALALAAEAFGDPSYRAEAQRIAGAVLDLETVAVAGRLVPVAGPWAVDERVVNPSYLARCNHEVLAAATGDARWDQVGRDSLALLEGLAELGLPPDWAVLDEAGTLRAVGGADEHTGAGRYGLDAARIPVRLAACPAGDDVAAALWPRLDGLADDGAGVAYTLAGDRLGDGEHPLGLVAAASAARAAGAAGESDRLMERAADLEQRQSTYYGAAWVALGEEALAGSGSSGGESGGGARRPLLARTVPSDIVAAQVSTTSPTVPPSVTVSAPTTVTAPTTAPPSATTAPISTAPTTIPSPIPSPTATTGPAPTTSTSSSVPGGTGPTVPPLPPGGGATTAPGTPTLPTVTTAPAPPPADGADDPAPPPTAPIEAADLGDLSTPSDGGDEIDAVATPSAGAPAATGAAGRDGARRRTGGIVLGGLAGAGLLGAALGLRERGIVRRAVGRSA
jgi:endoglucanase